MQESTIAPPNEITPTLAKLRKSAVESVTTIKGSFTYRRCDDPVRPLPFYNHRVNISSQEDWRGKIFPGYITYLVQDPSGQDVGFVVVDPNTRLYGRFCLVGYSVKLKSPSRKQFYKDLRTVFAHKWNTILGTRGFFLYLKHGPKQANKLSHELVSRGFSAKETLHTTGPGFNKEPNRLTLTLHVMDRIRTVKQFLYSLNKNSFYEGHDVILMCHPSFNKPSGEQFADENGPIPMEEWVHRYQHTFPRIRVRAMTGYRPDQAGRKNWVGYFEGFNRAICNVMSTEQVVTNMSCGVWWMPNWDLNLLKWRGFADILIPRYIELRPRCKTETYPIWHSEGYCDFIRMDHKDHNEQIVSNVIGAFGLHPGCALIEECAERNYGYVMGMTMTKEVFLHTGGFHNSAYPETSDLFFDDTCRSIGLSKLVSYDSVVLRTRYATKTFRPDPKIVGGLNGLWHYPHRKSLLFGNINGCAISPSLKGKRVCTDQKVLTSEQSVRLGRYLSENC